MDSIIYLIVENVRSSQNVGSILRSADGLGVNEVILCGYTPYPKTANDQRLPYIADKVHNRIIKSSLGAELTLNWRQAEDIRSTIKDLRRRGVKIVALEQSNKSLPLQTLKKESSIALIVGNEVSGVSNETLALCDDIVEIPMIGKKESFNVSVAMAMAIFYIRYML